MKERLDVFLVNKKMYETRNKAQNAIESGDIKVDNKIITSSSFKVSENNKVEIVSNSLPYVSRGGLKLEKALKVFNINCENKIVLDIGASTGGFTDCCLQNKAKKVYALDVGENQLHESLKNDNRVISLEKTNFRNINIEEFKNYNIDLVVVDVSFISLSYIFENVSKILNKDKCLIALIKPQFETNKKEHNKNGVVNNPKIHFEVIKNVISYANKYDLYLNKLDSSPIRGDKSGNIEYISLFTFNKDNICNENIKCVINNAFNKDI